MAISALTKRLLMLLTVAASVLIGTVVAGGSLAGAASEPRSSELPEALATYRAPTGPELALSAVEEVVTEETQAARDPSPSSAILTKGTFAQLQAAIEPQDPPSSASAVREWNDSLADLIVLDGSFTASQMSVPPGASPPSGSVMALIIDAHTGFVEGRYVGNRAPNLTGLSTPVALAIGPTQSLAVAATPRRDGVLELRVFVVGPSRNLVPLENATITVARGGHWIRTIRRAPHGRTRISLAPGDYTIGGHLEPPDFSSGRACGKTAAARVRRGRRTTLTIECAF